MADIIATEYYGNNTPKIYTGQERKYEGQLITYWLCYRSCH